MSADEYRAQKAQAMHEQDERMKQHIKDQRDKEMATRVAVGLGTAVVGSAVTDAVTTGVIGGLLGVVAPVLFPVAAVGACIYAVAALSDDD